MEYAKVDPALAALLARQAPAAGPSGSGAGAAAPAGRGAARPPAPAEPSLSVFVHVDPEASAAQQARLTKLGLPRGPFQGGIATATLSPDQVRKLAAHPAVRQIRLSNRLDLLRDDRA